MSPLTLPLRPRLEGTVVLSTNGPLGGSPLWHTGPTKKIAQTSPSEDPFYVLQHRMSIANFIFGCFVLVHMKGVVCHKRNKAKAPYKPIFVHLRS